MSTHTFSIRRLRAPSVAVLALLFALCSFGALVFRPAAAGALDLNLGSVSGVVRADGQPVANAWVELFQNFVSKGRVLTAADGTYTTPVVVGGTYDLEVRSTCRYLARKSVNIDGSETSDFSLPPANKSDAFGYSCRPDTFSWIAGDAELTDLYGNNDSVGLSLPFQFPFHAELHDTAWVSTNGVLTFGGEAGAAEPDNVSLPGGGQPNAAIYPFWDDLEVDAAAGVWTKSLGVSPYRQFVVEWRDVKFVGANERVTFEVLLSETGTFRMQYTGIGATGREQGTGATFGQEDESGTVGFHEAFGRAVRRNDTAVLYSVNGAPLAAAGPDVTVASGQPVTLNGGGSSDPDGQSLQFRWMQIAGPPTTTPNPGSVTPTMSPVTGPATLTYRVKVTDPFGFSDTDTVTVTVSAPK